MCARARGVWTGARGGLDTSECKRSGRTLWAPITRFLAENSRESGTTRALIGRRPPHVYRRILVRYVTCSAREERRGRTRTEGGRAAVTERGCVEFIHLNAHFHFFFFFFTITLFIIIIIIFAFDYFMSFCLYEKVVYFFLFFLIVWNEMKCSTECA